MKNGKIDNFTDLLAWQEGHKLVLLVYDNTRIFPKEELYSLVDQIRRAVASVTANIAEGFGRQTYKEKLHFYYTSQGSLSEVKNFLYLAKDFNYINEGKFSSLINQANHTHQLLQGLIKKTKSYIK